MQQYEKMFTLVKPCPENQIPPMLSARPPCQIRESFALRFSLSSDCSLQKCQMSPLNHLWLLRNYFALTLHRSCSHVVSHDLTHFLILKTPETSTAFCFIQGVEFSSNILLSRNFFFSIITVRPMAKTSFSD